MPISKHTRKGVTAGEIGLVVYGNFLYEEEEGETTRKYYEFTVNHETLKVETDGTITFEFYPSSEYLNEEKFEEKYIIQ